jgi:hypothetical protein
MVLLASCAPEAPVEDDVIIDFEASRFAQWDRDRLFAHVGRLWAIRIAERPGESLSGGPDFYIPNARAVLQGIVEQCHLGETIFEPQNHGMALIFGDCIDCKHSGWTLSRPHVQASES